MTNVERFSERMYATEHLLSRLPQLLDRIGDDPEAAVQTMDDDLAPLPFAERVAAMREVRDTARRLLGVRDDSERRDAARAFGTALLSWANTATEWQRNPAVDRLLSVLAGDGPVLVSPDSGQSKRGRERELRAVDVHAAGHWEDAAAALPELLIPVDGGLCTGEFGATILTPMPLRGALGQVRVGDRVLDQLVVSHQSVIKRDREIKNPFQFQGEVRVLYAPDPDGRTVWITEVNLYKLDLTAKHRWVYSPPEEHESLIRAHKR